VLLVEGAAGIGKTRLLEEGGAHAADAGLQTLGARGGELERENGFGVVRQLLEGPLRRASEDRRRALLEGAASLALRALGGPGGPPLEDEHSALHGLYWLTANLCDDAPALLVVDDVQWVDGPSLRFIIHLAHRIEGLPLGVVLALRTGEASHHPDLLRALALEAETPVIRPRPLSPQAIEELAASVLGGRAERSVAAACADVSGGNPFLAIELLEGIRRRSTDGEPTPEEVRRMTPTRIAADVVLRLRRAGSDALDVARAVAVLGRDATTANVAALCGIDHARVPAVAADLAALEILGPGNPLGFAHPIVRTSVYEDIPSEKRAELHRQAAELLRAQSADPESIALHLMLLEPLGDSSVTGALHAAGRSALARGAAEAATGYLRRALAERPEAAERIELLADLGDAETRAGQPDAVKHLAEAFDLCRDQPQRAAVGIRLIAAQAGTQADPGATMEMIERALEGLEDEHLSVPLEALALLYILGIPAVRERYGDRLERARARIDDLPPMMLSPVAADIAISGGGATEAATLAERALSGGELIRADIGSDAAIAMPAVMTLTDTGRLRAAQRAIDEALDVARSSGSRFALARISAFRGVVGYRRGALAAAEEDAKVCIETSEGPGWGLAAALGSAVLAAVHVERGEPDRAGEVLARLDSIPGVEESLALQFLRESRARTLLARGEPEAALVKLEEFDRWTRRWNVGTGVEVLSWRSIASEAHIALGQMSEARAVAAAEVELARRFGAAPKLGTALLALGRAEQDGAAIALLEQAVAVLETTDAALEHARARVELGSRRRVDGDTAIARQDLSEGMELAHRCGATALTERARSELLLAGARPRRAAVSGPDALTSSELRIARLAAAGRTNKAIAQALFVTIRTVEMHLSNGYRKLQISSRAELPGALGSVGLPGDEPA
jgi:DNA-binding NarL/FixJ family response regulator